jgi:hypothetical protein
MRGETYLVSGATGQRAQRALDGAGGLVDVALEGRGLVLVVGRHCGCWWELYVRCRCKFSTVYVLDANVQSLGVRRVYRCSWCLFLPHDANAHVNR